MTKKSNKTKTNKLKNISIFGTSSDAGKSTITFIVAKILQDMGYRVAPFKAQNVSNNAQVCLDGGEIAIAQYFQSKVLGLEPTYHQNPILLKSGRNSSASLIIEGKVKTSKDVLEYYRDLDTLKPAVNRCFKHLDKKFDCLVCEGAGSPVELNLMDKDLSNIHISKKFNTKIILVADIEKGGVFASIYGVYNLLPKKLRKNVIGVIVNKFRGDLSLFDEGIKIIEKEFKIPVLGVLPYIPFNYGFEDSQSLLNYNQDISKAIIKVGVIAYPYMSNYNDFEPLIDDDNINLEFIQNYKSLDNYDCIILPGSKLVIKDLIWLKRNKLFNELLNYDKKIIGICGGYEMMFKILNDKHALENQEPTMEEGLGFIDDKITFKKKKIVKKTNEKILGYDINGFEIHHGVSKKYPLYYEKNNISGTFVHELFDNDNIRNSIFKKINKDYTEFNFSKKKSNKIDKFINEMKNRLDIDLIMENIK